MLAAWVNVRFPRLSPSQLRTAIMHVVAALVVAQVLTVPAGASIDPAVPRRAVAAIFLFVLPALVYTFLAGLWLMKACQRMFDSAYR